MASFGDYNRVNTNVTAMDAQLSLNKINRDLGESRLRLSTGFKINNAEDDAAGFAIATKLKSRVAGLEQALQNVSDAKSVLGVVEGAYNSVMDNLIEMKSLATQGANETLGSSERNYLGAQIVALSQDIDDIAQSANFNGIQLLDGNPSDNAHIGNLSLTFQVGEGTSDTLSVSLGVVNSGALFDDDSDAHDGDGANAANGVATGFKTTTITDSTADNLAAARGELVYTDDTAAVGFRELLTDIDAAIGSMNGKLNSIGINQRSLTGKEVNLTEAITANSAARSRIMDTDFAKEQSNSVRLQILQQTATAALSQANMGPQAVLGFLG